MEFGVMLGLLMDGLMLTTQIFFVTLIGALPLGVVVALCRMSRFKVVSTIAKFYISILRGTPLMLQLMAIMFGPYYLFGLNMGVDWKFWACDIGFILNYAAYFGGDIRNVLLVCINFVIAALIWYPFFKAADKAEVKKEEERAAAKAAKRAAVNA